MGQDCTVVWSEFIQTTNRLPSRLWVLQGQPGVKAVLEKGPRWTSGLSAEEQTPGRNLVKSVPVLVALPVLSPSIV